MSAYSDWKCGALTDEEYKYYNRRECGGDDVPMEVINSSHGGPVLAPKGTFMAIFNDTSEDCDI